MEMSTAGAGLITAQLAATVTYADAASGASRLQIYSAMPEGDARAVPAGALLVSVILAKPCGTVAGEVLTLTPATLGGNVALAGGFARWCRWVRTDGALVFAGNVTDMANGGFFRLAGGYTPDGETSPLLQAGGLVMFGTMVLG